jgi:hypothetical protein
VKHKFYPRARFWIIPPRPSEFLPKTQKPNPPLALSPLSDSHSPVISQILTLRNPIALSPSRPLSQTLSQSLSPSRPLSQTLSQSLSPSHPSLRLNLSPFRLSLSYDPPKLKSSLFLHRRSSLHQLASSSTITYVHLFIYLFFMLGVRVLAC